MRSRKSNASCLLSRDMVEEILLKLPVKSLRRFKAVSKHVGSLVSSPNFVTKHLHNSKTSPSPIILARGTIFRCRNLGTGASDAPLLEKLNTPARDDMGYPLEVRTIVGIANGLFCIRSRSGYGGNMGFILWNPETNNYEAVRCTGIDVIGFGYHSGIQDYKLVGISSDRIWSKSVHVLSLRRGTWREVQSFDLPDWKSSWQSRSRNGVVVDGVWYNAIKDYDTKRLGILSIDLKEESFAWTDSPTLPDPPNYQSAALGLYNEKLCLFVTYDFPSCSHHLEMWVMEGKASWKKMLATDLWDSDIPARNYLKIAGTLPGSRVLLNGYSYDRDYQPVARSFVYDLSTNRWREILKGNYAVETLEEAYSYVESLVSPEVILWKSLRWKI